MSDLLRPRSITEIVDVAFQLYRRAPLEFMTAMAIIYVPFLALQLLVLGGTAPSPDQLVKTLALMPASMVVYFIVDGPLLWMASELYLGRSATGLDAWRATIPRLLPLFFASFLSNMMIGVGIVFLLVPGIYITALTFAVAPAVMIERAKISVAFNRSQSLSNGLKWHILATGFLAAIIVYTVIIGATGVAMVFGNQVVQQIVSTAIVIVIYPIMAITKTVLYYDARIRREGFDVEWMAGRGSGRPAPSPDDPAIA